MAKIQIKSEKLTPFGGIFSIMEQIDALLAQTIDSTTLPCSLVTFYNPQNEMFDNHKTKRYIFKTKRIFFGYPSIIIIMWL